MCRRLLHIAVFVLFLPGTAYLQEAYDTAVVFDEELENVVVDDKAQDKFDPIQKGANRFSARKTDPAVEDRIRRDDSFWYLTQEGEKKDEVKEEIPWLIQFLSSIPGYVFWILLVIIFAAVIITFLRQGHVGLFRNAAKKIGTATEEEDLGHNIFDIDYDKEIPTAIGAGRYHLAVRLLYLQQLKELAINQLIDYRQERTNGDYLMQLFNTPLYKDFFGLTRNYEYVWYGQFPVSARAFELMHADFKKFKGRLPQ